MLTFAATILMAMAVISLTAFLIEALAARRDRGYVKVERATSHPTQDRRLRAEGWNVRSAHDRRAAMVGRTPERRTLGDRRGRMGPAPAR
jgi:hypothetical protein